MPIEPDGDAPAAEGQPPLGSQATMIGSGRGKVRDVTELLEERASDQEVVAMAQRIARQLSIRRRRRDRHTESGPGSIASRRYSYRSDDIDLDRTIEVLGERTNLDDTDVIVREPLRSRMGVVLIVDVSGSMRGERVHIAAATVAALANDLRDDQLALVAFWSDAALLSPLDGPAQASKLLDQILRIKARGLTNIEFGLAVAADELARSAARRRMAIMLTDAIHNAGPDPRSVAGKIPELHILLQTEGEHDAPLAADLARLGHGLVKPVRTYRDVAPALNRLLGRQI